MSDKNKLSAIEKIKTESDALRGSIRQSLQDEITGAIREDDQAVIKIESIERLVEPPVDAAHRDGGVRPARLAEPGGLKGDRANPLTLPTTKSIPAAVDQHASEPGRETVGIAQRHGSLPGEQTGVLDGVLRLPVVEEDRPCQSIGPVQLRLDESGDGLTSIDRQQ